MGKIQTLEAYLAAHDFLNETAAFHFGLAEKFADAQPLDLPPREKVSELVKDGVPLFQREPFQSQVLDATEDLSARRTAQAYCGFVAARKFGVDHLRGSRNERSLDAKNFLGGSR